MKSVEAWVRRVRLESVPCKERRLVKFKAARDLVDAGTGSIGRV
jgi:hypothetical protein